MGRILRARGQQTPLNATEDRNQDPTPTQVVAKSTLKRQLFFSLNALVLAIVAIGMVLNPQPRVGDAVYVIILALICTAPVLFISSYRGKQSLLLVFLAYYFGAFGLRDLSNLITGAPTATLEPGTLLSAGETAIILGAICFIIGYFIVTRLTSNKNKGILTREWSSGYMLTLGVLFWACGFVITTYWQFSMGDMFSTVRIPPSIGGFIGLLRILQPLGTLALIYLFLTTRQRHVLLILIATMVADFGLGFLGDSKELAVRGPLLYLFSYVLLRERIPLIQVVIFVIAAGLAFNIFASYRIAVHSKDESRSEAVSNIGSRLDEITSEDKSTGERLGEGLTYFADRISLKHSVELILIRTGRDVAYQKGHTIKPILFAFIPRLILPNKEDSSMTGGLFNIEFRISESPLTKIATSQVGELYWNFGWPGLVIGMILIGSIMASLATMLRLDTVQTLPRFLFLLMTVYVLTLRFETAIAQNYTVWARSALLLILLNMMIPKARNLISARTDRKSFAPATTISKQSQQDTSAG